MLRRVVLAASLAALLGVAALCADDNRTVLGGSGEVYTVQRGSYASLFSDVPAGAGAYPVLALDIVRDGKLRRLLVPGTGGPEDEQVPMLALDPVSNRVYLLWLQSRAFNVVGYGAQEGPNQGWTNPVELAGDPASTKRNPQLATAVVRYQRLDAAGQRVWASRTYLHLVWYDDSGAGERQLYTAVAIEGATIEPSSRAFELRAMAGAAPPIASAPTPPAALRQKPVARRGRDSDNVGLAFVDDERAELVSLELRPIDGELLYLGDKARAVVIDLGHSNPGLTIAQLADKARAVVIDLGRQVLHPVVADFLTKSFLDQLGANPDLAVEAAVQGAWARLLGNGIMLQQGTAPGTSHIFELASPQSDGTSRAVDLRWVSRRALPAFPDTDLKLFLSPRAQEASVAWNAPVAVRYRETNPAGWDPVRNLALGPTLTREQAFKLVAQRLEDQ
jgi:hypothetical protein